MSQSHSVSSELALRFIIFHLNPVSARLRFLKSSQGQVCHPEPLPSLSDLRDGYDNSAELAIHPASYLPRICELLTISNQTLVIENDFRCWVDTPSQLLPVFLLRVSSESPCAIPEGFRWIELPDCFSLTDVERQMMRLCYQWLME